MKYCTQSTYKQVPQCVVSHFIQPSSYSAIINDTVHAKLYPIEATVCSSKVGELLHSELLPINYEFNLKFKIICTAPIPRALLIYDIGEGHKQCLSVSPLAAKF